MPEPSIRFEEFELDVDGCELRRSGRPVKLERIPMELLILLLKSPGKLVRRETIEQHIWGGNGVLETEHSINTAINKLRMILRDDSRDPHFIRTVIGHGYRFIANVKHAEPIEESPPLRTRFPLRVCLLRRRTAWRRYMSFVASRLPRPMEPGKTGGYTGFGGHSRSASNPGSHPRIGTAARKPRSRRQVVHRWLSRISGRDRNHCWVGSPYAHAQNSVTAV